MVVGTAFSSATTSPAEDVNVPVEPAENFHWGDVLLTEENRAEMNDQAMVKYYTALNELPPGWKRNPTAYSGSYYCGIAPYVHEDGRQSWRNPSLPKIRKVMAQMVAGSDSFENNQRLQLKFWKKYRLMIRSGMPLLAVQHTARMYGIDPKELETPELEQERRFWKRYHLMIKAGVPRMAVEQASRLFGADLLPKQATNHDEKKKCPPEASAGNIMLNDNIFYIKKYTKMYNVGVSKRAIESMARREVIGGFSKRKQVLDSVFASTTEAAAATDDCNAVTKEASSSAGESITTISKKDENTSSSISFFEEVCKGDESDDDVNVEFPGNLVGSNSHLELLVRRLVSSSSSAGAITSNNDHLVVSKQGLQNVLGCLKDAQAARDSYNSTLDNGAEEEIASKQAPLLQLWDRLGIRKPTTSNRKVDVKGLDQLVSYLEESSSPSSSCQQDQGVVESGAAINGCDSQKASSSNLFQDDERNGMNYFDFASLGRLFEPGTRVMENNRNPDGGSISTTTSNGVVLWNHYDGESGGNGAAAASSFFKIGLEFSLTIGSHVTTCQVVETLERFKGQREIETLDFVPVIVDAAPPLSPPVESAIDSASSPVDDPDLGEPNFNDAKREEEECLPSLIELTEAIPVPLEDLAPVADGDDNGNGNDDDSNVVVEEQDTSVTWEETEESVQVTLEVPGFAIDQLQITFRDVMLIIHGVRQDDGGSVEFHEELMLVSTVYNTDEMQAMYAKDVLTIIIPKYHNAITETRQIPISPLLEVLEVDEVTIDCDNCHQLHEERK